MMINIVTRWNSQTPVNSPGYLIGMEGHLDEIIQDLLQQYLALWWSSERSSPHFEVVYQSQEQVCNEKKFEQILKELLPKLKDLPANPTGIKNWIDQSKTGWQAFAVSVMRLEPRHFDLIESSGIMQSFREFAKMARHFDPGIKADDIYQAGRNVMTANFIQMLLGLPVKVTPSIFAYSMLYPYTDNYLDDPGISSTTKLAFNQRFRERLLGKVVEPANPNERTIIRLIEMIEGEWDRKHYPQVYESLLAIHSAQAHSLSLAVSGASPFELDVLGISLEKGGTSVLADGYLAAGELTWQQVNLLFGFGSFTQLMDDLEDIQQDLQEGRISLFTTTSMAWPLDRVTNQFIHYGRSVMADLSCFPSPAVLLLEEIMERCLDLILINTVATVGRYYHPDYLKGLERHLPFQFAALQKQRQKLRHEKISFEQVLQLMM